MPYFKKLMLYSSKFVPFFPHLSYKFIIEVWGMLRIEMWKSSLPSRSFEFGAGVGG